MDRCRLTEKSGFTLIEMVIAVAIFAVMMVIAYPGLTHIAAIGDQVGRSNRQLSQLQFALTYLNRDWMQVSTRKILDQYGDEQSNIVIADNSISFTRSGWNNLLQHKRSELQRVQYLVEDNQLIRRHWLSLDQGIAEEPVTAVVLDEVELFEIHFIDSSEAPIEQWPNPAGIANNPIALSVKLELKQFGQVQRIMETPQGVL